MTTPRQLAALFVVGSLFTITACAEPSVTEPRRDTSVVAALVCGRIRAFLVELQLDEDVKVRRCRSQTSESVSDLQRMNSRALRLPDAFVLELNDLVEWEYVLGDPIGAGASDRLTFALDRFPFLLLAAGFRRARESPTEYGLVMVVFRVGPDTLVYEVGPRDLAELVAAETEAELNGLLDSFVDRVVITR